MRLTKANIAGLTSPGQQAEMKSILAGRWPPLRPLPVFRYETAEYRATIDFDKKRGEWVCRKTSLPSNRVQELRGGLREITLALPHGEEETLTEGAEELELELEKDTNRRLQALRDWRENYENGARYFEIRDYLSESQQAEIEDSLRLSLTARQLQFNAKNVAYVFDALSTAGGRFAALMEFAKQNKAKQGTDLQPPAQGAVPEAESAISHDQQSVGISSGELGPVVNNNNALVQDHQAAKRCTDTDEFPVVSIKDVFPEPDQASLPERMADTASQPFEVETSEMVEESSARLVEYPHQEGHDSPAVAGFAPQGRPDEPSADRIADWSSRIPALGVSASQIAVFASLFLFAVIAFTVGLRVGRGAVGRRLRDAPKSTLAISAKSPTVPYQGDESDSRTPAPPLASSRDSAGTSRRDEATPSKERSTESTRRSEYSAEVRSTDSDLSSTTESNAPAKPAVNSGRPDANGLILRNVSPRASSKLADSPNAAGPIPSAPRGLTPSIGAGSQPPIRSTILVTVPGRRSPPFRVSFPKKAIAATSSFAVASQLSVLVSPDPGLTVAHQPARLEAGELVSFVWPRYPRPDRHRLAETIMVRATIGQLGQVQDVKFLNGSVSLLPATARAIRQWHYRPTLLDKRPVQAQQDVTIEFRPPQYSSQVSTRHLRN